MLVYLAIAMLACSIGFVLGGVLASNRGAVLVERLTRAENAIARQTRVIDELTAATRALLAEQAGDDPAALKARAALGRCEETAADLRHLAGALADTGRR